MNFFKSLEDIASKVELQFNIKAKDGTITVMVMPKAAVRDAAVGTIKPIIITGTADELDSEFVSAIWQPLSKTAGIVHNIAEYESASEKLSQENSAIKAQQEAEKNKAEARKKNYDRLIEKGKSLHSNKDYIKALEAFTEALEFTDNKDAVNKLIAAVNIDRGDLFATALVDEPTENLENEDHTV